MQFAGLCVQLVLRCETVASNSSVQTAALTQMHIRLLSGRQLLLQLALAVSGYTNAVVCCKQLAQIVCRAVCTHDAEV